MLAKIVKIEQSINSETPQIDVHVEYEDARFPATHQHPEGGKRLQIFTCPPEKFTKLQLTVLEEMILAGGEQLDMNFPTEEIKVEKVITVENLETHETALQDLIGTEISI